MRFRFIKVGRLLSLLTLLLALFEGATVASRAPYQVRQFGAKVALASSSSANFSYDLVGSDGGIFNYGGSSYEGSTGSLTLNKPIVGMASTPDGKGYWLVASDGGIFSFGDAQFYGSTGSLTLNKPIVGMASTPDGKGYWLVASDGGIFSFGDAQFYGSTGGITLNKPIVGMAADPQTGGYWLVASDGGIFSFNAPFLGAAASLALSSPVVGIVAVPTNSPYQSGSFGIDVSLFQCTGTTSPNSGLASQNVGQYAIVGTGINTYGVGASYQSTFQSNNCIVDQTKKFSSASSRVDIYQPLWAPPSSSVDPTNTLQGPDASCAASTTDPNSQACQAYNYGWNITSNSYNSNAQLGVTSKLWWLDVEKGNPYLWSADQNVNSQVVLGAIAFLRSVGVTVGVYSTAYQWGIITGNLIVNTPLWVAGGTAQSCTDPSEIFGGGIPWLVQIGYTNVVAANGGLATVDQDYAC